MSIHLVSYATQKYRHRQILLGASAKVNGVVSTATSWTLPKLNSSDFPKLAPDISLAERGSGFWAWKPYIIQQALDSVPNGDIVFYCDVGRKFPYILLDHPLDGYVEWMNQKGQDIMPGVMIPWNGTMSAWTKREAFLATDMDRAEIHATSPIQASFSFWRAGDSTRAFVNEWLSWCVRRPLVSDDPNPSGEPNFPDFIGHRHDQSLMTLCCLKHGIRGIDLGPGMPDYNERDPGKLAENLFGSIPLRSVGGRVLNAVVKPMQAIEQALRQHMTFGQKYE